MPDSRAEAKGLGSAKRDERPVRGRRHLVVKSQVKRQSRQKGECPGGFERTAFQDAFLPHPRECAGKRKIGRFSKTLEIISFNAPAQAVCLIRGQEQSPALEGFGKQTREPLPTSQEANALATAAALKPSAPAQKTSAAVTPLRGRTRPSPPDALKPPRVRTGTFPKTQKSPRHISTEGFSHGIADIALTSWRRSSRWRT